MGIVNKIVSGINNVVSLDILFILLFLLSGIVFICILLCIFVPIHHYQKKKGGIIDNPINFDAATGRFVYATDLGKQDIIEKATKKRAGDVHQCVIDDTGGTITFSNEDETVECQYYFDVEERDDVCILRLKQKKVERFRKRPSAAEMNGFWISKIDARIIPITEYAKDI